MTGRLLRKRLSEINRNRFSMGIILSLCNAGAAYYANGECSSGGGGSSSGEESWVEICNMAEDVDLDKVVIGVGSSGQCSSERAEKYVARRKKVEMLRSDLLGLERKHFRSVHPMTDMVERRMLKNKDFAPFQPFDRRKVLAALGEPSVPVSR